MKTKIFKFLPLATGLFLLFGFISCEKDRAINDETTTGNVLETQEFRMAGLETLTEPSITGGTADEAFTLEESVYPPGEEDVSGSHPDKARRHHPGRYHHLGRLLRKLDLDSAQRAQVHRLFVAQRHCIQSKHRQLRQMHHRLIHRANKARKDLIQKFRSHQINIHQLRKALKSLHKRLRHQIRQNHKRQTLIKQIRQCRTKFLRNLRSTLDHHQQRIFDQWVKNHLNHHKGPHRGGG